MCRDKAHEATWLEEQVWAQVEALLLNPEVLLREVERRKREQPSMGEIQERLAVVNRRMERVRDRESRLVMLYTYREIDDEIWKREKGKLDTEKSQLGKEKESLEKLVRLAGASDAGEGLVRQFCEKAARSIKSFTFEDKRLALEALQVRVEIDGDQVKVLGAVPLGVSIADRDIVFPHSRRGPGG